MEKVKAWLFKTLIMLSAISLAFGVCATAGFAAADVYPGKPVRLIVPGAPGSGTEIFSRVVAGRLTEGLGKQVIVETRPGAGGVIGVEMAAKAPPDGYTLLAIAAFFGTNPAFYKLPFDPIKDFTPISKLGGQPMVIVVHPSVPAKSMQELIALAKQKPGELVLASSSAGSFTHLAAELLKSMAKIDYKIVQFKGAGPAGIDLLGGHSQISISTVAQMLPHIKSGKVRALATCGLKRSAYLPDVPTAAESGVPGYEVTGWLGILAPAGTPAAIVDRLNKELKAILVSDELKKFFQNEGAEMDYLGPVEFGKFIAQDIDKWIRLVKEANIQAAK